MMESQAEYIERAVQWARSQIGSKDYPYLCLGFVEDAYERPNRIVLDGYPSAKEAADAYGVSQQGVPPQGSFVFYDCFGEIDGVTQNWGHVGICVGEGRVIHSWGSVREDGYLQVQDMTAGDGWTSPAYIGWTPLEPILKGMKIKTEG